MAGLVDSSADERAGKIEQLSLLQEELRREAKTNLLDFTYYTKPDYEANWHHEAIAQAIDDFLVDPDRKRLAIFVPPQHGKSELSTVRLPAYYLGRYPSKKVATCCYADTLAKKFANQVNTTVGGPEFAEVFPEFAASGQVSEWITSEGGVYKAVGIGGGLSGYSVDLAIIDDPVKDEVEASSPAYRERAWGWYTTVLTTRLHNDSKVIMVQTRWHEDDLAGRLLKAEPEKWTVIRIPAIMDGKGSIEGDPRKVGEPLWAAKHSLQKLLDQKALSVSRFNCLYQQDTENLESGNIKASWFEYVDQSELPNDITWDIWVDGAYTKDTKNDPTGFQVSGYSRLTGKLYVLYFHEGWYELPKAIRKLKAIAGLFPVNMMSRVRFEPKATGKSFRQVWNDAKGRPMAVEIRGKLVQEGKEARHSVASAPVESGRMVLVRGKWNEGYVSQLAGFPKAAHDEAVDLAGYACYKAFYQKKAEATASS
jgi:predicted phage terminase large subunit-like protein